MGVMAWRQASHTGSREMLIRGVPQIRQSEGNSVANRLSASREAPEAKVDLRATVPPRLARVRSPLLLKTPSRRLERLWPPAQTNLPQYSGRPALTQSAHARGSAQAFPSGVPCARFRATT